MVNRELMALTFGFVVSLLLGSASTSPLIIIDGIESTTTDLNALDPEVIDGFSILKDATATAMYGMRGANGVYDCDD